jgi:hypothetical protein
VPVAVAGLAVPGGVPAAVAGLAVPGGVPAADAVPCGGGAPGEAAGWAPGPGSPEDDPVADDGWLSAGGYAGTVGCSDAGRPGSAPPAPGCLGCSPLGGSDVLMFTPRRSGQVPLEVDGAASS